MMKNELDSLSDFDWDQGKYYEVELWSNGDCDGRFFTTKASALKCFEKFASNSSDCIKYHCQGDCTIIKEYGV